MEKLQYESISMRSKPLNKSLFYYEEKAWKKQETICGVDEVGRGCLSGPIVTVAAILNSNIKNTELKDSKLLSKKQLENLYKWAISNTTYSIGISNPRLIDKYNIYQTTKITMRKSLLHLFQKLISPPNAILIDAVPISLKNTPYEQIPIFSWTQGESKSASIAAAAIIAKVTRDEIMKKMHFSFPQYNLQSHKGYGTKHHITAIEKYNASVIHRKSFLKKLKAGNHDQTNKQTSFC